MSGGFWSLLTVLGPLILGGVIIWAIMKNRKEPQREIDRTERATHDLYKAQDEQDNPHRKDDDVAN